MTSWKGMRLLKIEDQIMMTLLHKYVKTVSVSVLLLLQDIMKLWTLCHHAMAYSEKWV